MSDDFLAPIVRTAVDDLTDRPRVISPEVARTVVARVAQHAYDAGRSAAIAEMRTGEQAAAILAISQSHLRRIAARYDIGWSIGRDRLFRPDDLDRVRPLIGGRRGRPAKRLET